MEVENFGIEVKEMVWEEKICKNKLNNKKNDLNIIKQNKEIFTTLDKI